jgi:amino acid transporter
VKAEVRCAVLDDEAELRKLGYKQQLRRSMSAFGNFALSFSIISILTGAVSLYGFGLNRGGPITMAVGWPVVSVFTLLVALSLAELASAYPTAGALYHWATILGGVRAGWWTAWLNLIGQVAVLAGIDYPLATFIGDALGLPPTRSTVLSIYAAVLLSHGVLNHVGIRVVTVLNELSAWYHLAGTALLVGALAWLAPLKPVSFLATGYVGAGFDYPIGYAFLAGMLQALFTFTGYDASAHVAEETHSAQEAAPRGIVNAVWVSAVVGWIMLLVITLAIGDLEAVAKAENPFIAIIQHALGPRLGAALVWMVIGAMWFCGLSAVTSNSRMLFAFARDGGPPGSRWLKEVSERHRTPAVAVWACVAIAFVLALSSGAYDIITSISVIGFYASYGIPIAVALRARRRGWRERGPWQLGRWSPLINTVAVVWIVFITILQVLPPRLSLGMWFGLALVLLLVYDLAWARRRFAGPPALKSWRQTATSVPTAAVENS